MRTLRLPGSRHPFESLRFGADEFDLQLPLLPIAEETQPVTDSNVGSAPIGRSSVCSTSGSRACGHPAARPDVGLRPTAQGNISPEIKGARWDELDGGASPRVAEQARLCSEIPPAFQDSETGGEVRSPAAESNICLDFVVAFWDALADGDVSLHPSRLATEPVAAAPLVSDEVLTDESNISPATLSNVCPHVPLELTDAAYTAHAVEEVNTCPTALADSVALPKCSGKLAERGVDTAPSWETNSSFHVSPCPSSTVSEAGANAHKTDHANVCPTAWAKCAEACLPTQGNISPDVATPWVS